MGNSRNNNIEGLRGVLMIWIILFHYTTRYGDLFNYDVPVSFSNGGSVGVAMFFIISGYFLAKRLLDEDYSGLRNAAAFAVNRYWRLFPAYFISVVVIYLVADVWFNLPIREANFKTFLLNCFLIYHPHIGYVDGAHWFIADLVKIQIVFSLFLLIPKKRTLILMILGAAVLVYAYINFFISGELFARRFLEVLLGICVYKAVESREIKYWILVLMMFAYQLIVVDYIWMPIYFVLFVIIVSPNIIGDFITKIRVLCNPVLVFLGTVSFSWYLIHQNIGYVIIEQMRDKSYVGGVFMAMAVTFVLAVSLNHAVKGLPKEICSYKKKSL